MLHITMKKSVPIQQQNSMILHRQKKAPLSMAVTGADEHREKAKSIPHKTPVTD